MRVTRVTLVIGGVLKSYPFSSPCFKASLIYQGLSEATEAIYTTSDGGSMLKYRFYFEVAQKLLYYF